ncbi:hypothetical protein [Maridesulfovibrio sp.]|uniref:hypothetical protein n=1 Tax=Maridesulfovibrio sp. TaxID=2795000 RepID=UPI0029C9DB00|nr:hypothetical protein [Maridesulfovibrio sp.]
MILKQIFYDIKSAIVKGFLSLLLVYIYFVSIITFSFFNGITDYASVYTSSLFVSFALSCIACRDMNLKIIRFDFQFRMTFVYLTLLLICWLTIMVASLININIINFKEYVSSFILDIYPNMQYELSFKGPIEVVMESMFYGLFSPFIYLFASLSFSFKKIMHLSVFNWFVGSVLLTVNGVFFGVLTLFVQVESELYLYSPFFVLNYIMLIILSYAAGKNSFAEVPNH